MGAGGKGFLAVRGHDPNIASLVLVVLLSAGIALALCAYISNQKDSAAINNLAGPLPRGLWEYGRQSETQHDQAEALLAESTTATSWLEMVKQIGHVGHRRTSKAPLPSIAPMPVSTFCPARKRFFFEKKNQKTFASLGHVVNCGPSGVLGATP